jgi:hypothetical protein
MPGSLKFVPLVAFTKTAVEFLDQLLEAIRHRVGRLASTNDLEFALDRFLV